MNNIVFPTIVTYLIIIGNNIVASTCLLEKLRKTTIAIFKITNSTTMHKSISSMVYYNFNTSITNINCAACIIFNVIPNKIFLSFYLTFFTYFVQRKFHTLFATIIGFAHCKFITWKYVDIFVRFYNSE